MADHPGEPQPERAPDGHLLCTACGYDLRGHSEATRRCPECGEVTEIGAYEPPDRTPVTGAAIIASLGIYCPVPILRGALFGLFPGIARRSWRMAIAGLLVGAGLEIAHFAVLDSLSVLLNLTWEPRDGFNRCLAGCTS